MKRDVHFAHRAIRLKITGAAASDLADFLFGYLPQNGITTPHAELSLESHSDSEDMHLIFPPVDHSASNHPFDDPIHADRLTGSFTSNLNQVAPYLMYVVDFHLANLCQAGLYLHAASVEKNGKAIILPATSGSGKSTLTCWMAMHGLRYLSDEATFIENNSTICTGFTRPAILKKGSEKILPDFVADSQLSLTTPQGHVYGWMVNPKLLKPIEQGASLPIDCFIFTRYQPQGKLNCEHLSSAATAFELAKCLINARNLMNHGFPEILRLTRCLPGWKLSYNDLHEAQKCIEEITSF